MEFFRLAWRRKGLKQPVADFHHLHKNHGNAHHHQPERERLPDEELEKESARKTQLSSENDDAQREEMFHSCVL